MRIATAVVVLSLFFANHAGAQALRALTTAQPIRQSIASIDFNRVASTRQEAPAPKPSNGSLSDQSGRKIAGARSVEWAGSSLAATSAPRTRRRCGGLR
jgi:hypothetical protein